MQPGESPQVAVRRFMRRYLTGIAWHEAGHCVAMARAGIRIASASIKPEGTTGGRVRNKQVSAEQKAEIQQRIDGYGAQDAELTAYIWAGIFREHMLGSAAAAHAHALVERSRWYVRSIAKNDRRDVRAWAGGIFKSPAAQRAMIAAVDAEARMLVDQTSTPSRRWPRRY